MSNFLERFESVENIDECIIEMNFYSLTLIYSVESELMNKILELGKDKGGFYETYMNDYAEFLKSIIKFEKDALIESEIQFTLRNASVGNFASLRDEVKYAPQDAFENLVSDLREYTQMKKIDQQVLNEEDFRTSNLVILDLFDSMNDIRDRVYSDNEKILAIIDNYYPKK